MINQTSSIFDLAKKLVSNTDVDSLLAEISDAAARLTDSEAASILLLDKEKNQLTFKAATGEKGKSVKRFYVPIGKGIAGWVAEHGQPLIVNNVQTDTRFTGKIDKSSGFSTKSILAIPMFAKGDLVGVCEALNKREGEFTEADQRILENLSALAAITIHNAKEAEDHRNFFSRMMEIITMAVEGGDSRMTGHSFRVANMACQIGKKMGLEGEDYKNLYYAALMHDIGMVATHDLRFLPNVLNKTIERTPEKLHPLVGSELVKGINLLAQTAPAIRHHHEAFDGTGHPDGLAGDDIPLAARILFLCEEVEKIYVDSGLTGDDFEKKSATFVKEQAGKKFDPAIVEAYLNIPHQAAA